jgi:hypothetical protein
MPMSGPRWLTRTLRQHDRIRLERARAALNRVRGQLGSGSAIESRVLVGRVAEQVTAAASDVGARLVVTVLQPNNGFGHPKGSTTYRILCGSNLPVLALPGGWTL